mmetsp:Transcript_14294/g.43071  ORF Transcript_14294/g.43071 Transcript_14294/m.43071 type:complete len:120 (-) Transcript_14294:6-365(-)
MELCVFQGSGGLAGTQLGVANGRPSGQRLASCCQAGQLPQRVLPRPVFPVLGAPSDSSMALRLASIACVMGVVNSMSLTPGPCVTVAPCTQRCAPQVGQHLAWLRAWVLQRLGPSSEEA